MRDTIIIAADDYGIRETSGPILRLVCEGKIDRVGVLVHFVSSEEAKELLETGVKIDIHLELIEFLKSGRRERAGVLGRGFNFVWRYALGRNAARQAEAQWEQQIQRFQELFGRLPDGLNSHEHIHYFPVFFRVFIGLAKKYDIGHIRFGAEGPLLAEKRRLVSGILRFFFRRDLRMFIESGLHSPNYMASLDWIIDWTAFRSRVPVGKTVEIVVHPERMEEQKILSRLCQ